MYKFDKKTNLKRLAGIGMFSAMAFIVAFLMKPLEIGFLSIEVKDAIITLGAFIFGPVSGVLMALISSLLELLIISSTGPYGFIMNFASSATFALTASLIYMIRKNMTFAIIGISSSVVAVTGVMMVLNLFVTPFYMKVDQAVVVQMIPVLLLPFNLLKSLLNAGAVLLLYKPLARALRRVGLSPREELKGSAQKGKVNMILSLAVGGACVLIAVVFLIVLHFSQAG